MRWLIPMLISEETSPLDGTMEVGRTILVLFGLMTTENFWKTNYWCWNASWDFYSSIHLQLFALKDHSCVQLGHSKIINGCNNAIIIGCMSWPQHFSWSFRAYVAGPASWAFSSACEALLFSARISVRGRALANRQRCPLVSTARVRAC